MAGSYQVGRVAVETTSAIRALSASSSAVTIKNIGTTTLELHNAIGNAYGTGYPLAPGAGMTFDTTGPLGGDLFVSSSAAGGILAFIRY